MINGSVNATNATINAATTDLGVNGALLLIPVVLERLFAFLAAPFLYPEMWWLLIHLLLTFVLFELYFERHEGEDLGWSAALANSIVMVFISMELVRILYHHAGTPWSVLWNVALDFFAHGLTGHMALVSLSLLLGALGLATAVINYFHLLPRRLAFLISGHKTVNLLAYLLIVAVYRWEAGAPLPLDVPTLIALVLFGAMMWSLIFFVNHKFALKAAAKARKPIFR